MDTDGHLPASLSTPFRSDRDETGSSFGANHTFANPQQHGQLLTDVSRATIGKVRHAAPVKPYDMNGVTATAPSDKRSRAQPL